ncbi:hypothetical protein SLS58_004195 [Diplodia intermedia]|uniref:Uncharacterized protein n=1 Tax=Diplodia intermedia TaxID=856260 RepID=A0ABR3TV47_9PEZI
MDRTAAETRDLSARLKYLHEAARVIALASPETSAFLESQYSHLLAENDLIPPDSRKREEQVPPRKPKKKGSKVQKPGQPESGKGCKMKIYSCLRCSSKARLQIPSNKARMGTRKLAKSPSGEPPTPTTAAITQTPAAGPEAAAAPATAPANPAPANANSKKRAKARKGGLQALLANSKKETNPSKGFGLDLMDLMRSS